MTKLTETEKKYIRNAINNVQTGHGIMDIVKSLYNNPVVHAIVSKVGPIVFENYIKPFIEKKLSGNGMRGSGLNVPGKGLRLGGEGLKLAGQRGGKLVKGSPEAKARMSQLRAMRKKK